MDVPSSTSVQKPAGSDDVAIRTRLRLELLVFVGVALAMTWFYAWSARAQDVSWHFGQAQSDYYNLLVDGMLDGHLSLKVQVPPQLLAIGDPYNPANRPPGMALHDASLYHGRYYLYFGAAPVVTLLLPFRLLTHTALPLPAAVVIFASAGFLVAGGLWWAIRRRYFPGAGLVLSTLVLVALGTANMVPVLVRRANIWELPLAAAYFYSSVALAAAYFALHGRHPLRWLALAGLTLGLAVASRPTYLYAAGLLVVPSFWLGSGATSRIARWRPLLLALLPFVAVGVLMALYNYERFGNPLEFGVSYQFSGIYESKARHFSWSYVPYNLRLYFMGGFEWSRYFPFLHDAPHPLPPAGHFGIEEPCGLWSHLPLLWFPLLLAMPLDGGLIGQRRRLGVFAVSVLVMALGTLCTLGFFYAAIGRYETDFAPGFALLGAIGVLLLEHRSRRWRPAVGRIVRSLTGAAVLWSVLFGVLFSLILYENFRRLNPDAFRAFAAVANHPARWLERSARYRIGPVEFDLRLPHGRRQGRECLALAGCYKAWDAIFVEYGQDDAVRFGYISASGALDRGGWLRVSREVLHRVRIELASLLPLESAGSGAGLDPFAPPCRVHVTFDGQVVLDAYRRFADAFPDRLVLGRDPYDSTAGEPFSGTIEQVARLGRPQVPASGRSREIEFASAMKRPVPQPLFTASNGNRTTVWSVAAQSGALRFGVDGSCSLRSEWIPTVGNSPHHVQVCERSDPWNRNGRRESWLTLDGMPVWTMPHECAVIGPTVVIGRNASAATNVGPRFDGQIAERGTRGGALLVPDFDRVELSVALPADRIPHRHDPLVTAGVTGGADFLYIDYLDEGRIRFGLEHWGKPAVFSAPIRWNGTGARRVEVELGTFPGAVEAGSRARDHVRIAVDGECVWDDTVRVYRAAPADVYLGENPLGGTGAAPTFSGTVTALGFLSPGETAVDRKNSGPEPAAK